MTKNNWRVECRDQGHSWAREQILAIFTMYIHLSSKNLNDMLVFPILLLFYGKILKLLAKHTNKCVEVLKCHIGQNIYIQL
jgi:hypothetical protein